MGIAASRSSTCIVCVCVDIKYAEMYFGQTQEVSRFTALLEFSASQP